MNEQTKLLGFRIIGALYWEYLPDAIVIPPLKQHIFDNIINATYYLEKL